MSVLPKAAVGAFYDPCCGVQCQL